MAQRASQRSILNPVLNPPEFTAWDKIRLMNYENYNGLTVNYFLNGTHEIVAITLFDKSSKLKFMKIGHKNDE